MASARLQINVISAHNLYNADGILAGKSDPYVIVEVPGQPEMKFQTPVINNNLNPVWNHVGEIHGFMDGDVLQFTVMDSDTWPKKDSPLGTATLTVQDFYPEGLHAELQLAESKTSATLTVQIAVVGSDEVMMEGMEGGQVMMEGGQVMMDGQGYEGQQVIMEGGQGYEGQPGYEGQQVIMEGGQGYEGGQQVMMEPAQGYEGGQQVMMEPQAMTYEGGQPVIMEGGQAQEMGGMGMVGQDGMQVEQALAVTVMNARGLYNADGFMAGKSDPYCICSIPGKPHAKFTTPTINNCLDPDWNHVGELIGFQLGDSLDFEVWDSDTFPKPDQLLGKVMLSPEDLAAHPEGLTGVLQLSGGLSQDMGTLEVCIQFLGAVAEGGLGGQVAMQEGEQMQMQQELQMQQEQQIEAQQQMMAEAGQTYAAPGAAIGAGQPHRVKVRVIKANGLYNADSGWAGKSDPYVICQVPGQKEKKFQTPVIKNNLDPVWDYPGIIENVMEGENLEIEVWDKDTFPKPDDFLGKVVIPSTDFLYQAFDNEVILQESKAPSATITLRIEVEPDYAGADATLAASQAVPLSSTCANAGQVYQTEPVTYAAAGAPTMVSGTSPAVAGGTQYMSGTSIAGAAPSYATSVTAGQQPTYSSTIPARAGQPTVYSSVGQSPTMGQASPPPGYQMYTGPIYNSQTARPSMPSMASFTSQSSAAVEPTVCAAPTQSTTTFAGSAPAPMYSQAPATTTYTQAAPTMAFSQPTAGMTNFTVPGALPANSASSTAQPLTIYSSPTTAQPQQVAQGHVPVSTMYATPAVAQTFSQAPAVGSYSAQQGAPVTYMSPSPAPAATYAPATTYATPQMTASQQLPVQPQAATFSSASATAFTGFQPQPTTRGQQYTMASPGQPYPVQTPGGYPMVGSTAPQMTFQQHPMQVQGAQPVAYAAPTMIPTPGMQPGIFQAGMQPTILPGGAVTAGMQQPGLIQGVQPGMYQPGVPMSGMQMSNAPGGMIEPTTTVH